MGRMNGLGKLIRDEAPWVKIVHFFNHRLELPIKDTFTTTKFYHNIDEMLTKLYYLYQKSPKCLNSMMLVKNQFHSQQKAIGHGGWILNFRLWKEYWEIMSLILHILNNWHIVIHNQKNEKK